MTKSNDSELIIKTKIWKRETFELINYLNDDTIESSLNVNLSGVLRRDKGHIYYSPGEDQSETDSDLLRIHKNTENGKYIINCGNWSKDLSKLIEQQGAFLVYRGITIKELSKNYNYRYYKLSQGDIFKIGRVYFKVLDIHLNREGPDTKSNNESNFKGTMIRSSSCNSIIVKGQQVIKGSFTPYQKKNLENIYYSKNDISKNNNSIMTIKNSFQKNDESVDCFINKKEGFLPKINSNNELITFKKKSKNKKNKEQKNTKNQLILKVPKKKNPKNKPSCRICYGEETNDDNPLICPCICKGSMKYIHYECLKNWLNSKIEEEFSIDSNDKELDAITYNRKDIACELCKEKFPDYIKYNDLYYNILFYKPKFEEFIVLESMKLDNEKTKYIHLISFDNKNNINLGRSNECDLSIAELSVSRYHCILHKEEGDLYIEDNNSKFGTLILIQNNKLVMNELVPLRLQINKTFIKLKVKKHFIGCCGCSNVFEARKYDYQVQNSKCFDILSYFIIKENNNIDDEDNEDEEPIEENKSGNNNKQLIEDYKEIKNENKIVLKENEKNDSSSNINEVSYYLKNRHNSQNIKRIKKLTIKKGKNDKTELPKLDKINIDNIKDNISLISDKNKSSRDLFNQQNKQQINLIKIKKSKNNINFDKTNSQSQLNINNNIPNKNSSKVIKDYNHKKKKK